MQQYPQERQLWEKGQTERALDTFQKEMDALKEKLNSKDGQSLKPDEKAKIMTGLNSQLNRISQIGDIETRLEKFRKPNKVMTERELRWEKHYSSRLGENLIRAGKPRPDKKCQAHAIIAGKDPGAGRMRAMLAVIGVRVDDPVNGVWLPAYEKYMPHWALPNAVTHAWLNHRGYHSWMETDMIGRQLMRAIDDSVKTTVIAKLQRTALMLQYERHNVPAKAIQTKEDTQNR